MKFLHLYIVGLLALLIVSCSDSPMDTYSQDELLVTACADVESRTTFVQGDGVIETHWEFDDPIGLWTDEQRNLSYKAVSQGKLSEFQPAGSHKLKNTDGQKVYAYYPFTYKIKGDSIKLPYTEHYYGDNSTAFMHGQGQIDNGVLNFKFKHLFAYLKIKISAQNIKDAFSKFNSEEYVIENGGIALLNFDKYLAIENAYYNLKTNEYSGTLSDRIHVHFGKKINFDSDSTYTYMVPVLPVSGGGRIGIGFFFPLNTGSTGTHYNMFYKIIPNDGLKEGNVYVLDLTDSQEASDELYEALNSFYHKTGGDQWFNKDNWLSDKPLNDWYGINEGVLKYRTLRSLELAGQNLTGAFPEEIAVFMETADHISLGANYLTGPIPDKVKNHRKWDRFGWDVVIGQIPTKSGQMDLTNSNLYIRDIQLDYLFTEDAQKPKTLHEFIKQNKLTQIMDAGEASKNQSFDNIDDLLGDINENRINLHLDYQKKGLKTLVFCKSSYYTRDWLRKKILEHYGELEGVEWVYGHMPLNSINMFDSYVFDNNAQLIYNASYNFGCPTVDNDLVHEYLSKFFHSQFGEPTEHPKFTLGSTSSDFSKDGEVFLIQEATEGKGINMVFLGEGFIDREMMEGGLYERTMQKAADIFFSIEPYKSLRNRFNIYGVKVVSPNAGYMEGEHGINENNAVCFEYSKNIPNADKNPPMVSVIYRNFNWGEHMGRSHTYMYDDGSFVAYMYHGVEDENVLIHESGGHGFAKLLDEYVESGYEELTLPEAKKSYLDNVWTNYSWGANVDWRSDAATVKWSHFLKDSRYANEGLGLYEGSYLYGHGAYRPTENSMMRHNDAPFNAPSREQIYKRVMQLSEGENWKYDYEEFVKFDEKNRNAASRSAIQPLTEAERREYIKNHRPPTIIKGTWRDAMKKGKKDIVVPLR